MNEDGGGGDLQKHQFPIVDVRGAHEHFRSETTIVTCLFQFDSRPLRDRIRFGITGRLIDFITRMRSFRARSRILLFFFVFSDERGD